MDPNGIPHHRDVFYFQLLLLHRSALDWTDIHIVNGVIHLTHQDATCAIGLLNDENEVVMAFEELLAFGTAPAQLQWIFALLAVEGNPVMSI